MKRLFQRILPTSLQGQMLLAVALVLLAVQSVSGYLRYSAQMERREVAVLNGAAFSIMGVDRLERRLAEAGISSSIGARPSDISNRPSRRGPFVERSAQSPLGPADRRLAASEDTMRAIFESQGFAIDDVIVTARPVSSDPIMSRWIARHHSMREQTRPIKAPREFRLVAAHLPSGDWAIARIPVPRSDRTFLPLLIGQTLLLYAVLVGAMALVLRRITRPLARLTRRVEQFGAAPREAPPPIMAEGPDDISRLIEAHNVMEARVRGLLDEKDVMLGAIGHDLKTPLAALRVRIESVDDDVERRRMAATIEDIVRTLDDILSLARVGRPSDPLELTDVGALAGAVAEEFEDMDRDVTLDIEGRVVARLRPTWLRRALRNLVENAVRYGERARVRVSSDAGFALLRVEDDGPGIPAEDLERMQEPFTRLDASRNKALGGAGLGLALARAIAEQHGGSLTLENRAGRGGENAGLVATLRVPLQPHSA